MGRVKSNAARVTMADAALDPLAELWVFVFVNNGDFAAHQPRLSRYHRGVDDTTVVAAVESLRTLYDEVGRWEARLAGLGAKKVTRPLTEKYPDLRPLAALFAECHELFGDPNRGCQAADFAMQTMRRAGNTATTLAFDTQTSRADAIPPKIVEYPVDPPVIRDALTRRDAARRRDRCSRSVGAAMTAATYVPYQMGLVSQAGPTAAPAAGRADSSLPPPAGFTSLSTSFFQFGEVCAATCDRMTKFTARGPLHLPTHPPGGGDGG